MSKPVLFALCAVISLAPARSLAAQVAGEVDDSIVSPERPVSWAIPGVGGFLGMAAKKVAIPMDQLKLTNDRLVLAGATKDALEAMSAFQYAKS